MERSSPRLCPPHSVSVGPPAADVSTPSVSGCQAHISFNQPGTSWNHFASKTLRPETPLSGHHLTSSSPESLLHPASFIPPLLHQQSSCPLMTVSCCARGRGRCHSRLTPCPSALLSTIVYSLSQHLSMPLPLAKDVGEAE